MLSFIKMHSVMRGVNMFSSEGTANNIGNREMGEHWFITSQEVERTIYPPAILINCELSLLYRFWNMVI